MKRKAKLDPEITVIERLAKDELPIQLDAKLTPAEIKLLCVLAIPDNRLLTVDEIATVAGIHRDTYFRSFKKPHFIAASNALALSMVKQAAVPLVHAGLNAAMQGSFLHWRVLMEMGQLYDPKRISIEADGEGGGAITIRFADPRRQTAVQADSPLPFTDIGED